MQKNSFHIIEITRDSSHKKEEVIEKNIQNSPHSPVWQSFWWTRLLLRTSSISGGFCIYDSDNDRGFFVQKRSIGAGKYGLFCVGYVTDSSELSDQEHSIIQALTQDQGCLFFQLEPLEPISPIQTWKQECYKHFVEPTTARIDLSLSEDQMLHNMKQKGRYNIRLAQKKDITITQSNDPESVEEFYDLLTQTTQRNKFSSNNLNYYQQLCSELEQQNLGGLYLAKKDNSLIAGSIFVFYGNIGTYYYGASTNDNLLRRYMASYLLQWHAILEAKKRKCAWFDFLGIADNSGHPKHLAGVTDFKMKFGPIPHTWPKTQIYIPHPVKYKMFTALKGLKRLVGRW